MASSVLRICPRCGLPYSYIERRIVGDLVYYYTVHYGRVNGKRVISKCYLGPRIYEYSPRCIVVKA